MKLEDFTIKFSSAFTLPRRFVNGEDLTPFLDDVHEVGSNGISVFFRHAFIDWPEIRGFVMPVDRIRALADRIAEAGLYMEAVFLCDCQPTADDGRRNPIAIGFENQVAWVQTCLDELRGAENVIGRIANEPKFNGVDPWRIVDALALQNAANRPFALDSGDYFIVGNEQHFRHLDLVGDHPSRKPDMASEASSRNGPLVSFTVTCDSRSRRSTPFTHFRTRNQR